MATTKSVQSTSRFTLAPLPASGAGRPKAVMHPDIPEWVSVALAAPQGQAPGWTFDTPKEQGRIERQTRTYGTEQGINVTFRRDGLTSFVIASK